MSRLHTTDRVSHLDWNNRLFGLLCNLILCHQEKIPNLLITPHKLRINTNFDSLTWSNMATNDFDITTWVLFIHHF